ncbi:hypothetical protein RQP46_006034 [Phenoliferia psychrophenolica]
MDTLPPPAYSPDDLLEIENIRIQKDLQFAKDIFDFFLLQSLRLNYIRHVLPNHAVQSSIPGTGPYNLISFDAANPTLSSPRRRSLETSIHHRRMGNEAESIAPSAAPPVVVHSPVRTPQDSPVAEGDPARTLSALSPSPSSGAPQSQRDSFLDDSDAPESPATPYHATDVTQSSADDHPFDDDEDDDDDRYDESPLEFPPSQPLSFIPENEVLGASKLAYGEALPQSEESEALASSLLSSSRSTSSLGLGGADDSLPRSLMGERHMSVASSGVSLFGVSRVTDSSRDRSDSDSSLAVPILDKRVGSIKEDPEEELVVTEPPTPPPPPGRIRAGRERRRVNISGRMLVPISEPVQEEDAANSSRGVGEGTRPRSNTDPDLLAVPTTGRSALSALLSSKSDSPSASNPFSALYAALASRASDALSLSIYFPHSKTPNKPLKVNVKKDLSVEEVIGAGLWSYWEEGREPKLDVDAEDPQHDETTKWNLRIVEDDGEVDEDFPALDRTRAISAFSFGEFAIVKASPQQLKDNRAKQSTIQRRPSRVLAPPKRGAALAPPPLPVQPVAATSSSMMLGPASVAPAMSSFQPGTMAVSSALAVPVLLKVRLPPLPGVEAINTTINVPNDMYLTDVLDHLCKKRGLDNPKDWALVVEHDGVEIVVPLDRTVNSLGDRHNLNLVKRSQIPSLRGQSRQATVRTNVNPSASIFKRLSEPPQPKYQSASDLTSAYVRYQVQRKLPMPLGRHPRTIAIDGDYIHFMPSDSKGMLSGGRTSSFHISNVHECKVSRRAPSSFKLLVQKDRVDKRYDFEAESPKQAAEIVAHIKLLMAAFEQDQLARQGR